MNRTRSTPDLTFVLLVMAGLALALLLLSSAAAAENDAEFSNANLAYAGRVTFQTNCTNCHGLEGRGDGEIAQFLEGKPADLTGIARRNGGVFPRETVYYFIDGRQGKGHKNREMPIWGEAFSVIRDEEKHKYPDPQDRVKEKITGLVAFLETIQE